MKHGFWRHQVFKAKFFFGLNFFDLPVPPS